MGAREPQNHLHQSLGGYNHIKTLVVPERPDVSLVKHLYQCKVRFFSSFHRKTCNLKAVGRRI